MRGGGHFVTSEEGLQFDAVVGPAAAAAAAAAEEDQADAIFALILSVVAGFLCGSVLLPLWQFAARRPLTSTLAAVGLAVPSVRRQVVSVVGPLVGHGPQSQQHHSAGGSPSSRKSAPGAGTAGGASASDDQKVGRTGAAAAASGAGDSPAAPLEWRQSSNPP